MGSRFTSASGPTPVARGGSGDTAPPLAARPTESDGFTAFTSSHNQSPCASHSCVCVLGGAVTCTRRMTTSTTSAESCSCDNEFSFFLSLSLSLHLYINTSQIYYFFPPTHTYTRTHSLFFFLALSLFLRSFSLALARSLAPSPSPSLTCPSLFSSCSSSLLLSPGSCTHYLSHTRYYPHFSRM